MRYIKESERLPPNSNLHHLKYSTGDTTFKLTGFYEDGKWHRQNRDVLEWHPNLEWLDEESPKEEEGYTAEKLKEIAVDFAWENYHGLRGLKYQKMLTFFEKWFADNKTHNPKAINNK